MTQPERPQMKVPGYYKKIGTFNVALKRNYKEALIMQIQKPVHSFT